MVDYRAHFELFKSTGFAGPESLAAFSEIYDANNGRLEEKARRKLPNHLVQDMVQSTWLRFCKKYSTIKDPEKTPQWLVTVLKKLIAEHYRRNNRAIANECTIEEGKIGTIDSKAESDIQIDEAAQYLEQLSSSDRDYLLLDADGYSPAEIAKLRGKSITAITSAISRAKKRLKKIRGES